MTTAALVIAALLAVACVIAVALPFLRDPEPADDRLQEPDELERRRLELAEERDRALADLKELEFDHRTGKVSDDDYRELIGPLRARAASALSALEPRAESADLRRSSAMSEPTPEPARVPEPFPPPDEGEPPQQPEIPEPFPPPDEGDRPQPPSIPEPGPTG